jgi:hypothetical protein
VAQQEATQTTSAERRPDIEQIDEVAAVEVAGPYRHQAGNRVILDSDEAGTASDESRDVLSSSEFGGVDRHDVVDILDASGTKICHAVIIDQSPSVQGRSLVARPINRRGSLDTPPGPA